jgi:hypothetical protein
MDRFEKVINLFLNIENILFPEGQQLTKWEEEQLEKGKNLKSNIP